MIRHTLFFRFRPDATAQQRRALLEEQARFPQLFPWMRNLSIGRNISERDSTFEYALTVDFDSEADLQRYLTSADHEVHVVQRFRPLIASRAIVSFEPGRM